MVTNRIYDTTVFKRFFESGNEKVLGWAQNVYEKVRSYEILPKFIKRPSLIKNDEGQDVDNPESYFYLLWFTVCHFFSYIVNYGRQYLDIKSSDILFNRFVEERGLIETDITNRDEFLKNYIEEYRKRGTIEVFKINDANSSDGEFLRLISYEGKDDYLYARLRQQDLGWSIGNSSPTWTSTQNIRSINKGWENTFTPTDVTKYPVQENADIVRVQMGNEGRVRCLHTDGDALGGWDYVNEYGFDVFDGIGYVFSFIAYNDADEGTEDIALKVGFCSDNHMYSIGEDEDIFNRPTFSVIPFQQDSVAGCYVPATENQVVVKPKTFLRVNLLLRPYNYEFSATDMQGTEPQSTVFNFLMGELSGNQMEPYEGHYNRVIPFVEILGGATTIYYTDIKFKPAYLPFSQGYFGQKNISMVWARNSSNRSIDEVKAFTRRYLIPYTDFLYINELK